MISLRLSFCSLLLTFCSVFFFVSLSLAQESDVYVVKDVAQDFLVFDEGTKEFVPYLPRVAPETALMGFLLNTEAYRSYSLEVSLQPNAALFVENAIVALSQESQQSTLKLNIDSLARYYSADSLFFTIYRPGLKVAENSVRIVSEELNAPAALEDELAIILRQSDSFEDFYIIAILLLMGFLAFLYNYYPHTFSVFFSTRAFAIRVREDSALLSRPIMGVHMLFYFQHATMLGLLLVLYAHFAETPPAIIENLETASFMQSLKSWVTASVVCFIGLMLKYVLVSFVSGIFTLKGFEAVHFIDYLRLSVFCFYPILLLASAMHYSFGVDSAVWLSWGLSLATIFAFVRLILLYFKLIAYSRFRYLHLFLYLCSTELIPLVVGIKIF